MDIGTIARAGLQASVSQFNSFAADAVQSQAPSAAGSSGALARSANFEADMVGQMMALASYRANARALKAADDMAKATIDLIG